MIYPEGYPKELCKTCLEGEVRLCDECPKVTPEMADEMVAKLRELMNEFTQLKREVSKW